ncbi:MAG: trigger factor [Alistipes sp.]|nr:trigger factor [Candidatus Alistipes equi]
MNFVTVEKEQGVRLLKVTVDQADYSEAVDKSLRQYKKKVNMPGFRPGMVPLSIVTKMYGKSVTAEESFRAASDAAEKYIQDNKIEILRNIIPSDEQAPLDFDANTSFEYSFEYCLEPKCNLAFTKDDKIEYVKIAPDETARQNYRNGILSSYSEMVEVESVEKTDTLTVKLDNGTISVDDAYVGVGSLEEKIQTELLGKQKGFTLDIDINDIYKNDAQKKANLHIDDDQLKELNPKFAMEIQVVKRLKTPELNEEFFKKAFPAGNVTDEASFEKYVDERLDQEFTIEADYLFAISAQKYITEKADVQISREFLKNWLYIMQNGKLSKEDVEKNIDDFMKYFTWVFIKEKYAILNEIKLTKEDIKAKAAELIKAQYAQYGMLDFPEDLLSNVVEKQLENREQLSQIEDRALDSKIVNLFKEQVTVVEKFVSAEEFTRIAQEINK